MNITKPLIEFIMFLVLITLIIQMAYTQLPATFNSTAHPTLIMNGTDYQSWMNWLPFIVIAVLILVFITLGFSLIKKGKGNY
jgi:hypothetical protein